MFVGTSPAPTLLRQQNPDARRLHPMPNIFQLFSFVVVFFAQCRFLIGPYRSALASLARRLR